MWSLVGTREVIESIFQRLTYLHRIARSVVLFIAWRTDRYLRVRMEAACRAPKRIFKTPKLPAESSTDTVLGI
jgi:hypothetical protein